LVEVAAFLGLHGIAAIGAPLIRYLLVDYNTGVVEVDIGIPTAVRRLPVSTRVRHRSLPAGLYGVVVHSGAYDSLVETTSHLLDWAREHEVRWAVKEHRGVTRWAGRVEHYLVGPPLEADPLAWRTEVAILTSGAQVPEMSVT